jgi:cytochrome P450
MMSYSSDRGDPSSFPVPEHVDPKHVMLFDFDNDPGYAHDPQKRLAGLRDKGRVFFTPKGRKAMLAGGTWVFTGAADIRAVLQDPETFQSSGNRPFGKALGENWVLVPVDLDAPQHTRMRAFLNPLFSPKRMSALAPAIAARAEELIAPLKGKAEIDFNETFARPFPVSIFLELFGLPTSEMPRFSGWVEGIIHGQGGPQIAAMRELRDHMRTVIEQKRADPQDDLISQIVTGEIDGQSLTYDEIMGTCVMLFMGGLDTVTSQLGFIFRWLGEHPKAQTALRAEPEGIPTAVEELLRLFPIIVTGRIAAKDFEIDGATIKQGESIACPMAAVSRDATEFADPETADIGRAVNRHSAFGLGPHRCLGSHLARRELNIAVEQWLKLLPPFRVKPGVELTAQGAGVVALTSLPLVFV